MKCIFVLFTVLGASVAVAEPPTKSLEGDWVIESAQDDGDPQDEFKGVKWTFKKDGKATLQLPDGESSEGLYKVDVDKSPHEIDLGIKIVGFLVVRKGLFNLKGDELVICQPADEQADRPTKIDGSKCWLWKLKRAK